jgi:hypothetical protein
MLNFVSCLSYRYIKDDGSLWLLRTDDQQQPSFNVTCPFHLKVVVGFAEKVAVETLQGEILIRIGCTLDRIEGDGWIFIEHRYIQHSLSLSLSLIDIRIHCDL